MENVKLFVEGIATEPAWKFCLIGILLVLLILLLLWRKIHQPSQVLAFGTDRGKVYISRRAICEMIGKVAARTQGVVKCRSAIREKRSRISINMKLHVRADANLKDIEHRLEDQIVEVLKRNFGFDNIGAFTTHTVSVVGELPDYSKPSAIEPAQKAESTEEKPESAQ